MKKFNMSIKINIFLFVILLTLLPLQVYADMGPKPTITVKVTNPPTGEYYLDLLVQDEPNYYNLEQNTKNYNSDKLKLLQDYNKDSWHAGLAIGTRVPLHGELTGKKADDYMIHSFSYVGVPDYFKIIITTPDNKILVSEEIHRTSFNFNVTYNYLTGQVKLERIAFSYVKQFFMTFIPTVLLEGICLVLFGFSTKRNWIVFLIINFLTQLFLTATLGSILIKDGLINSFVAFIPLECIIFIFEILAFSLLLKEHKKVRRIAFAFTANLISSLTGIILLTYNS